MRKSREEAAQTRRRIVEAAAREFRKNGIVATGLNDLMRAAGLTHGGFYKHFESKDQLVAEACTAAVDAAIANWGMEAHPLHERIEGADVTDVELQGHGLVPRLGHQADDLFGFRPVGMVGEDRTDPAPGEALHGAASEAAAAAGDDGDPGGPGGGGFGRHLRAPFEFGAGPVRVTTGPGRRTSSIVALPGKG